MSNFEDNFHKQVGFGRKLGLIESLILQELTDVLTDEYQNVLKVNTPDTVNEWYRVASKLIPVK